MQTEYLSLYDYWKVLYKRRFIVLIAAAITTLSTFVYTKMQPTIYQTEATISISLPPIYAHLPGSDATLAGSSMDVEIRMINSPVIAERVAHAVGILPDSASADKRDIAARQMLGIYSAHADGNYIKITATGHDRDLIMRVANSVVGAYKDYDLDQKTREARQTVADLTKRKTDTESSLQKLEHERDNFMVQNPDSGILADLQHKLSELQTKKKQLLATYTEMHPIVVEVTNEIADVQQKLSKAPNTDTELDRINRDLRASEELYATLNRELNDARSAMSGASSFVAEIAAAPRPERPISPNMHFNVTVGCVLGLILGIAAVFILENLDVSISTVEEIEQYLNIPVLGIVPYIPLPTDRVTGIKKYLIKKDKEEHIFTPRLLVNLGHKSPIVESYHTLRTNLFSQAAKGRKLTFVLTSSGALEGKTLTGINMAMAAASFGMKTLLVDMDMRKQAVHKALGLHRAPGVSDIVLNRVHWSEAVQNTVDIAMGNLNIGNILRFHGFDNLRIITSGKPVENVISVMDSPLWATFVDEWRREFDLVIIDSPPILYFVDAVMVAKHTDGMVVVYRSGKISRLGLKRACGQVTSSGVSILGIILNDVQAADMGPRYSYYGDYASYYYSSAKEEKSSHEA
jgi:tyrosine-protein kinase Etk/Wzc